VANPDSEREPSGGAGRPRISERTYDSVLVFLAIVAAAFAFLDIGFAIEGSFDIIPMVIVAAIAVFFGYLFYRLNRKRRRQAGSDFNF